MVLGFKSDKSLKINLAELFKLINTENKYWGL